MQFCLYECGRAGHKVCRRLLFALFLLAVTRPPPECSCGSLGDGGDRRPPPDGRRQHVLRKGAQSRMEDDWSLQGIVGAMIKDAQMKPVGKDDSALPGKTGKAGLGMNADHGEEESEWPSDSSWPQAMQENHTMLGDLKPVAAIVGSEAPPDSLAASEWPPASLHPRQVRDTGTLQSPAHAHCGAQDREGAVDGRKARLQDAPCKSRIRNSDCRRTKEERGQEKLDHEWIKAGGYADARGLRDLVRMDRAISAVWHEDDVAKRGGRELDEWTARLHKAALMYDYETVEGLVLEARASHASTSGASIMVRLPGAEEKFVDATTMTTGLLIEQILTEGRALPRDEDGRVVVSEEMEGEGDWIEGAKILHPLHELRAYEPLRSMLAHRVIDGFDVYSSADGEEEGEEKEGGSWNHLSQREGGTRVEGEGGDDLLQQGASDKGEEGCGSTGTSMQDGEERVGQRAGGDGDKIKNSKRVNGVDSNVSAEEKLLEMSQVSGDVLLSRVRCSSQSERSQWRCSTRSRGPLRRPHVNDFLAAQFGPYREAVERFFTAQTWSKQDLDKAVEWMEWHDNQTVVHAPPGTRRLSAQLWLAALHGRACEEAAELVRRGAHVNSRDASDGSTALHKACLANDAQGVQALIDLGADVEARDVRGRTVLLAACRYGMVDVVRVLLGVGAEVLARDREGWGVLHCCAVSGSMERSLVLEVVRGARQQGVTLEWELKNRDGFSAAQEAERLGFEEMAEYLDALARGESGNDTWIGHGLDQPFPPRPLLAGGQAFVDSSDSEYDPEAPDAEAYRRITKQSKALWEPVRAGSASGVSDPRLPGAGWGHAQGESRYSMWRTYAGSDAARRGDTGADYFDETDREEERMMQELLVRHPHAFLTKKALRKYWPALEHEQRVLAEHDRLTRRAPQHPLARRLVDSAAQFCWELVSRVQQHKDERGC